MLSFFSFGMKEVFIYPVLLSNEQREISVMGLLAVIQSLLLEDAIHACDYLYQGTSAKVISYDNHFNPDVLSNIPDNVILLLPYLDNNKSPELSIGHSKMPISFQCQDSYVVSYDGFIYRNRSRVETETKWFPDSIIDQPRTFEEYMVLITKTRYIQNYRTEVNPMYGAHSCIAVKGFMYRGSIDFPNELEHPPHVVYGSDLVDIKRTLSNYATLLAIHKRYKRCPTNEDR